MKKKEKKCQLSILFCAIDFILRNCYFAKLLEGNWAAIINMPGDSKWARPRIESKQISLPHFLTDKTPLYTPTGIFANKQVKLYPKLYPTHKTWKSESSMADVVLILKFKQNSKVLVCHRIQAVPIDASRRKIIHFKEVVMKKRFFWDIVRGDCRSHPN